MPDACSQTMSPAVSITAARIPGAFVTDGNPFTATAMDTCCSRHQVGMMLPYLPSLLPKFHFDTLTTARA